MKRPALQPIDHEVLRLLTERPPRRWPRATLALAARCGGKDPDRTLRKSIQRLRRNGIPIVSSSREPGYAIARTIAELDAQTREDISRMRVIYDVVSARREVRRLMVDRGVDGAAAAEQVALL